MALRVLGISAVVAIVAATVFGLFIVPADVNQGQPQRILYLHVATAWLAYLSFGVTTVACIWWLIRRDPRADAVALAGAEVGVVFIASTIWAGMMWGRPVWGTFWDWGDPRLTSTAVLLALYLGYLLIRRLTDDPQRRATRAAIIGIIAAIDLPIVHFSVTWWRGLHQPPTFGDPENILNPPAPGQFVAALLFMLAAFSLAWLWLAINRYRLARLEWSAEDAARRGALAPAASVAPAPEPNA
ncbi:MAG TPA: cytochrome c biogenesis protein CcsA [Candidatus Limnocylindria bacterium]|jgi:heme exporter protein C